MVENMTHNIMNKSMVKKVFINNNTFSGCLHFKGGVQLFHLDLQDNMHLFQPLMWCDMAFPNWVPISPMLGSLQFPKLFLIPGLQVPVAFTLHLSHTPAWACDDNTPIEPWHFLFVLQLSLSSSPIAHRYCSKWKHLAWGIQSPEEYSLGPISH